ncbi:MAG TPA: TIGR04283 family arsenosugar biosynthesis glycosyltransferase [Casimicrobiaceae bacterium]|nr:TIGR04283 family arsenosugar biosynthesis glycosyltransferase [Casimicrobiaceae bacterium]
MRRSARLKALSIVVPVLDEADGLRATLTPLQSLRGPDIEIIVVDGGSRDASRHLAQSLADHVLIAPRGRAVQMNVGASIARGDTVLFLHADCVLPSRAVQGIATARARGAKWGRFDVALRGRSRLLPVIARCMNARSRLTGIATGDQGMFVAREAFDATGGFPAIPLMEDVAMSSTLQRVAGAPACLTDRIEASGRRWDTHGAWKTIATMWSLRFAYWRGADAGELAQTYYRWAPRTPVILQVFAKPPVPGRVKTRLARTIGADAAADVYRDLVQRTLAVAVSARAAGVVENVEVWIAPDASPGILSEWCEALGVVTRVQLGNDLGARMHAALKDALSRNERAIVIGTDVPDYDIAYLAAAAATLERHDAVIGPAEDGGYVLVGLARDIDLFDGVRWSTSEVLHDTRAKLAAANATWHELPRLWDVDTEDDLKRWLTDERHSRSTAGERRELTCVHTLEQR